MDEITMLVPVGAPLPSPGQTVEAKSDLTDTIYLLKVRKVTQLRWNKKNDLIVSFTISSRREKPADGS